MPEASLDTTHKSYEYTKPPLLSHDLVVLWEMPSPSSVIAALSARPRFPTLASAPIRRYDIPLSPEEIVLAESQLEMVFSSTHSGASMPVLDAVDVYAQTRSDFGWDAHKEALAAKYNVDPPSKQKPGGSASAAMEAHPSLLSALEASLREVAHSI